MASEQGSGSVSGQDIKDPVYGPREEPNAAATATAAAEPPAPPPAPPVEVLQGRVHERPGDGGGSPSSASAVEAEVAAQAADRKGKKVVVASSSSSASPSSSADSSSPPTSRFVSVSGGEESCVAEKVDIGTKVRVSWKEQVVGDVVAVPKLVRPIDLKNVFDDMMQRNKGQVKPPTLWPRKRNSVWSKVVAALKNMVLKRIRRQRHHSDRNSIFVKPHVDQFIIDITGVIQHYELLAGQGEIFNSNELHLRRAYSGFRPVLGDGECFYRSFIFSYLEQVLDRQDTHEEHRLFAAVKEVAIQHARLGWNSNFSKSCKAFKKLIKKVMRWKRQSRWKPVPTTNSYRKEKLLQFFRGYDTTKRIFAFLRLVAAIWIYSHREEYEPHVAADLGRGFNLRDWCFREVMAERIDTDHVQMTALVTALGVPLRVEDLFEGIGHDLYTGQEAQDNPEDNRSRSTCCPRRRRHMLLSDHEVPRVTVLFSNGHYDIIYPHRRDGSMPSTDEGCSRGTGPGPGESSTATGGSSSKLRERERAR